jgi:hypothetical protein
VGLETDSIFIAALTSSQEVMQTIDGRLYSTAIPMPDEDAENVPVPYVIVTFNGLNNEGTTKDDPFEGDTDVVQIGVEVTAVNREQLAELTQLVRTTIHDYLTEDVDDERQTIDDYQLSAEAVQYDSMKPCYWQTIRYQCDVYNGTES